MRLFTKKFINKLTYIKGGNNRIEKVITRQEIDARSDCFGAIGKGENYPRPIGIGELF